MSFNSLCVRTIFIKLLVLLVLLIIVFAVGAGGYVLGSRTCQGTPPNQRESVYPKAWQQIIPTPITNVFNTWNLYISPNGYSVKYPSMIETTGEGDYFDLQLTSRDLLATFVPISLSDRQDLADYVTYGFCIGAKNGVQKHARESVVIYTTTRQFSDNNICLNAVIPLSKKGSAIDIQAKAYNDSGVQLFNKIVSTLRLVIEK